MPATPWHGFMFFSNAFLLSGKETCDSLCPHDLSYAFFFFGKETRDSLSPHDLSFRVGFGNNQLRKYELKVRMLHANAGSGGPRVLGGMDLLERLDDPAPGPPESHAHVSTIPQEGALKKNPVPLAQPGAHRRERQQQVNKKCKLYEHAENGCIRRIIGSFLELFKLQWDGYGSLSQERDRQKASLLL